MSIVTKSMPTSLKESALRSIWALVMPSQVEPLNDTTLFRWIAEHRADDIEFAIRQVGEKMYKNISKGIPLVEKKAVNRVCAMLNSRTKWRRQREEFARANGIGIVATRVAATEHEMERV